MPACAPVSETAGTLKECKAMAVKAIVVCSPVASNTSISRSLGKGMSSLASRIRLSVTPLIAETTTTMRSPLVWYLATRAATCLMRSVLPTEVPPYFCTIKAITSFKTFDPEHDRCSLDDPQPADPCQSSGHRPVRRVMQHQDQRHAGALVPLRLDYRGNANLRLGEN